MKKGICSDCGTSVIRPGGRCKPCWYKHNSGKNNANWTGGRICMDCTQVLKNRSKSTKRCSSCYQKSRNKHFCKICNVKIRNNYNKTCAKCFGLLHRKENNPTWKGGLPKCKSCSNSLSRYKGCSTGFCQKCYRGPNTKVWNKDAARGDESIRALNPENYQWRKSVYKRDNFSCQICSDGSGGNLVAHHLENYRDNPLLRFVLSNGVTLCENCHKSFHKKYGLRKTTERQFVLFKTTKLLNSLRQSQVWL